MLTTILSEGGGVFEGADAGGLPEVGEDDDAGDCRVGAPEAGEGIALYRHHR